MENTVKSITTVSKPFPDGQRVTALAIEYDRPVNASAVSADCFDVEGRTVTGVCVSDRADGEAAQTGSFVVIALDPKDENATTITNPDGSRGRRRPPRPENGREPARPPMEPIVFPDGRIFKGPHGIAKKRAPLAQQVRQTADITAADGSVISAWTEQLTSDKEINEWADLFVQRRYEDMDYNLYIPEDYDPSKKYPLLLFISDAGCTGESPRIALEQGIGATIWATEAEQRKHPCFVVAPQHNKEFPITNDNYWATDDIETVKSICDEICREYSIDTDRVYSTGQSMGCMSTFELLIRYPDYFGGALPVAGHWGAEPSAKLWNQNVWFFMSDEDRGAAGFFPKLVEEMDKIGAKYSVYEIDADQPTAVLSEKIAQMDNDGCTFRITRFTGDSIMRPHQPDRTDGGGHNGTWHLVYQIEAARDWLFRQKRNS